MFQREVPQMRDPRALCGAMPGATWERKQSATAGAVEEGKPEMALGGVGTVSASWRWIVGVNKKDEMKGDVNLGEGASRTEPGSNRNRVEGDTRRKRKRRGERMRRVRG